MIESSQTVKARRGYVVLTELVLVGMLFVSCSKESDDTKKEVQEDPNLTQLGSIEVTAELTEIPEEQFPNIPMYDYAYVLKYKVLQVHRGQMEGDTIYVGHYNPLKARDKVADARMEKIGGNLKRFRAGEVHRMAMEVPIEDHFMGGIINKYHDRMTGPIYLALWTNKVDK